MVFLWFSYGFPMVFRWFSNGFPIVFHRFSDGFLMVLRRFSNGFRMVFLCIDLMGAQGPPWATKCCKLFCKSNIFVLIPWALFCSMSFLEKIFKKHLGKPWPCFGQKLPRATTRDNEILASGHFSVRSLGHKYQVGLRMQAK